MIALLLSLGGALGGWNSRAEAKVLERFQDASDSTGTWSGLGVDSSETVAADRDTPVASSAPVPSGPLRIPSRIRVVLQEGLSQATIGFSGVFTLEGKTFSGPKLELASPQLAKSGLPLASDGSLLLEPATDASWYQIGRRTYRGALRIRNLAGRLALIGELDLEDYLLGVVPGEIGRKLDPLLLEAVKAQAVVARTYAVRGIGQYGNKPWDLRDDVRDQVYEGMAGEDPLCARAVRETRGLVLLDDQNRIVDAFYHSTSGGATADIAAVWPGKPVRSYLRGVADTAPDGRAWGAWAPAAAWTETWPAKSLHAAVRRDLKEALGSPCDPGEVVSLSLSGRDASDRARTLVVKGRKKTCEVPSDRIRWALKRPGGAGILRSCRFLLDLRDGHYIARGTGNGHGVGLSQTGALGRARAGQDLSTILLSYYPGTRLVRAPHTTGNTTP